MIPTIGRTVHFVLPRLSDNIPGGDHRAAIISQVWGDRGSPPDETMACALEVSLDPVNDHPYFFQGLFPKMFVRSASQDPTGKALGSWHQPEGSGFPAQPKAQENEVQPEAARVREPEPSPAAAEAEKSSAPKKHQRQVAHV